MNNTLSILKEKGIIKSGVFDLLAITFIYFAPALSHMAGLPIYYLDPMRLLIILALAHTKKENSVILALTLPLFSFFISSHPVFAKAGLIMMELTLNIALFFYLAKKFNNVIIPILSSIIISKVIYYLAKYAFINLSVIKGELFSTPILIQLAVSLLFTGYIYYFYKRS